MSEVFDSAVWHDRTIGYIRIGHYRVSTCRLITPETHCGQVWPFESGVFDDSEQGGRQMIAAKHYKTRDEARIGHAGIVAHWSRKATSSA